jgi:hypothetical protein
MFGIFSSCIEVMRTGGGGSNNGDDSDYLFAPMSPPSLPQPPTPTHMKSHVGMMPMQPVPANVMSPDEMLRAYAERRPGTGSSVVSYPAPVANYNGNGMRTLYSPTAPAITVPMTQVGPVQNYDDVDTKYHDQGSHSNTEAEEYEVGTAE